MTDQPRLRDLVRAVLARGLDEVARDTRTPRAARTWLDTNREQIVDRQLHHLIVALSPPQEGEVEAELFILS
jgi:hypothetical protein